MFPGVANLFADLIEKFPLTRKFKFIEFLDALINFISVKIEERKGKNSESVQGRAANYGLFSKYAYEADMESADKRKLAHRMQYEVDIRRSNYKYNVMICQIYF